MFRKDNNNNYYNDKNHKSCKHTVITTEKIDRYVTMISCKKCRGILGRFAKPTDNYPSPQEMYYRTTMIFGDVVELSKEDKQRLR